MKSFCLLAAGLTSLCVFGAAGGSSVRIRFIDSATGYAVQPDRVEARSHAPGAAAKQWSKRPDGWASPGEIAGSAGGYLPESGKANLALEPGKHTLTVFSARHELMGGEFRMTEGNPYSLDFYLDPLELPEELRPETVVSLRLEGATLLQGFVVADDTGEPLANVRITSSPSAAEARTDGRGFFRFYVPAPVAPGLEQVPANLRFEKPGYGSQERLNLELWSGGDWTYRMRLQRGGAEQVMDENTERRRAPKVASHPAGSNLDKPAGLETTQADGAVAPPSLIGPPQETTLPENSTVRVPRNIRVLKSDGTTIDYVTLDYYCKHVLPAEWIAGWAGYTGGSNSLNAGAVALRSYAIAKINAATATSTYDICGTSSCQVYGTTTSSYSDTACNFTANWVVINASGAIPSAEYSAENNSAGFSCGDGFTQPTTGCVYDPICTGEVRYGHGRGMCQWGTARWATARKMAGRATSDATPTGYPRRDWKWIVEHYYPTYALVKGAPLVLGDDVKALKTLEVRACPGGTITNGASCALVGTRPAGNTGVIIGGPVVVTADGYGFIWYQVQWSDLTIGWSVENYLERIFSLPGAPASLVATPVGGTQINLGWTDTTAVESGVEVERAISPGGPWIRLSEVAANVTTYADRNLFPGSTWHYRVRAVNAGGSSAYSGTAMATTAKTPPVLASVPDQTVIAGIAASVTNSATATDLLELLTDFEPFMSETANGAVLFRAPRYSGSTSANLEAAPDLAAVTDTYPVAGHGTGYVLRVTCNFTNTTDSWLRLTTAGATTWPNPVIDLRRKLRFDIYSDRAVRVGLGCRETTTATGTGTGSNGGTTGGIEWVGVTNVSGSAPVPSRTVGANTWTSLTFDLPKEPVRNFTGGNGILSTASGLGVLEHLAIVPAEGGGVYNVYVDNFVVISPRTLTFGLASGSTAGASVNPTTGLFTWPTQDANAGTTNAFAVYVTDNGTPASKATNSFAIAVAARPTVQVASVTATNLTLNWSAMPGTTYRVQFKTNLDDAAWVDVTPDILATGGTVTFSEGFTAPQRFYRVLAIGD